MTGKIVANYANSVRETTILNDYYIPEDLKGTDYAEKKHEFLEQECLPILMEEYVPYFGEDRDPTNETIQFGDVVTVDTHYLMNGKVPRGTWNKYVVVGMKEVPTHNYDFKKRKYKPVNLGGFLFLLVRAYPENDKSNFKDTLTGTLKHHRAPLFDISPVYGPISNRYVWESEYFSFDSTDEFFSEGVL